MKLEIKLKDPKCCDGCRLFRPWIDVLADDYCELYKKVLRKNNAAKLQWGKCPRPQICIKQNGK